MVKITYYDFENPPFGGDLELAVKSGTKAVVTDGVFDSKVVLIGKGFVEDNHGGLKAGIVEKLTFLDEDGDKSVVVTGHFKAAKLGDLVSEPSISPLYNWLFKGDDVVTGSSGGDSLQGLAGDDEIRAGNGADYLYGGEGDDVLVGGKGADTFYFESYSPGTPAYHDVIRDFDIKGDDADDLMTVSEVISIRHIHNKQDTLLTLENGSTILLEDVKRGDFIDYWQVDPF